MLMGLTLLSEAFIVAFTSVFGLKHLTEKGALEVSHDCLRTKTIRMT